MNVIEETSGKKVEPKKSLSSQTDDVLHNIRAIIDQIQEGKRHNYEVGDYYHSGYIRNALHALELCEEICKSIYKDQLEAEICIDVAKKMAPDKIIVIERGNN